MINIFILCLYISSSNDESNFLTTSIKQSLDIKKFFILNYLLYNFDIVIYVISI
ncbi:MAG: hypothetical protein ACMZHY_02090 [Enterobacterales bacterium]